MSDKVEDTIDNITEVARITGYWADGVVKGVLIAAPPLMMLGLAVGLTLWVIRRGTRLGGLE